MRNGLHNWLRSNLRAAQSEAPAVYGIKLADERASEPAANRAVQTSAR